MRAMALTAALMVGSVSLVEAAGFWLPANDLRLRQDVTLLADEGVIRVPTQAWPIPAGDIEHAVSRVRGDDIHEPALLAALVRVRAAVSTPVGSQGWELRELRVAAGEQGLLRDYGTLSRENGEITLGGGATTERWSVNVRGTVAASPQDDRNLRLDGSDATLRLGNWQLSLNALDRWYGPGYEGSLILSTNARPMPQLSIDRLHSTPFPYPVLRWLGPWRFSATLGRGETDRPDVARPLFMAMRASFQPLPILEFGLSRSAQFCGQNAQQTRPSCNLSQFGRVLVGQDNVGFRGVGFDDEPGNQMAGIDMRLTSPFRSLPVAIYGQAIGEDSSNESQSIVPNRFLGLFGGEAWMLLDSGSALRARLEWAGTSCKFYSPTKDFPRFQNCAYRQGVFQGGYRYRTRNIGHTADADSESFSASLNHTAADGSSWGFRLRRSQLDRYGGVDLYNPLTMGKSEHRLAEISWSGRAFGYPIALQLGFEEQAGSLGSNVEGAFGFVQWRRALR